MAATKIAIGGAGLGGLAALFLRRAGLDVFAYEKNRAILVDARKPLPRAPLCSCLGMALTHHRRR
jgi:2-polyprenyl-6-methoxyphenol hydroxylase-like FAD-dependent oxidoreductase